MNVIKDVVEAIKQGKLLVVTFMEEIDAKESYAEKGMRARLTGVDDTTDADVVSIRVDFAEFEQHNLPLESASYYGANGQPTRTARQAGYYRPQDKLYFDLDEQLSGLMVIESEETVALFKRFIESSSSATYVQWLEERVMELEAGASSGAAA